VVKLRKRCFLFAKGEKRGAGTDANVFATLFGSKGTSSRLHLKSEWAACVVVKRFAAFRVRTKLKRFSKIS